MTSKNKTTIKKETKLDMEIVYVREENIVVVGQHSHTVISYAKNMM